MTGSFGINDHVEGTLDYHYDVRSWLRVAVEWFFNVMENELAALRHKKRGSALIIWLPLNRYVRSSVVLVALWESRGFCYVTPHGSSIIVGQVSRRTVLDNAWYHYLLKGERTGKRGRMDIWEGKRSRRETTETTYQFFLWDGDKQLLRSWLIFIF